jgi:hypothetical protein
VSGLVSDSFVGRFKGLDLVEAMTECCNHLDIKVRAIAGWETRRSSSRGFKLEGTTMHWTAGSDTRPAARSLVIRRVLAQFYAPAPGRTIEVVSGGRTGHCGMVSARALAEQTAGHIPTYARHPWRCDSTAGYGSLCGIEVEASGVRPLTRDQYDLALAGAAVPLYCAGLPASRAGDHARVAGSRKVDLTVRGPNLDVRPYARTGEKYATGGLHDYIAEVQGIFDRLDSAFGNEPPTTAPPTVDVSALPTLRLRSPQMRGSTVEFAQSVLAQVGFSPGAIDGWFGPATDRALREWQTSRGFTAHGILSRWSWRPLLTQAGYQVI